MTAEDYDRTERIRELRLKLDVYTRRHAELSCPGRSYPIADYIKIVQETASLGSACANIKKQLRELGGAEENQKAPATQLVQTFNAPVGQSTVQIAGDNATQSTPMVQQNPSVETKRFWEKPVGLILVGVTIIVVGAAITYYFGWT